MRREAVLIPRVEHDHFVRVQFDVRPNEKKVVGPAVRLVEKPLDTNDPSRDIPIQGLQGDRVMSATLPGGLDLGNQGSTLFNGSVPAPFRGARKDGRLKRDEEDGNTPNDCGYQIPSFTDPNQVGLHPPVRTQDECYSADANNHADRKLSHGHRCDRSRQRDDPAHGQCHSVPQPGPLGG